jgi:hypothetical protein
MRTSNQKLEGDVIVNDEFQFSGMITGSTTIVSGGHFVLHGTCCRDLFVEPGSVVHIHGTVAGNVYNRGGNLEVYGTIGGALYRLSGKSFVAENSMIKGHKINLVESKALSSSETAAE